MAFGFPRKTEQTSNLPSVAISISDKNIKSNTSNASSISKLDDKLITASMYNCPDSPISTCGRASSPSQEESDSTASWDDFSLRSADIASNAEASSDDGKSLSPRSEHDDATCCVYSMMFLFRMRAACCGQTSKSALGYRTELVPETPARSSVSSPASRSTPKSSKGSKKHTQCGSKARNTAPVFDRLPKASLPTSTSDSWIASQPSQVSTSDDDQRVLRAARSILNKLTIEKFEALFRQLVACGIKTPSHISTLMREVFEKATTQHQFIPMYAELCVRLERDPYIMCAVQQSGDTHNFQRLLLNQCQRAFEQLLEPCVVEKVTSEEDQMRRKQQALGNIKLIGELLVQGMLSSDLLVECGNELLRSRTSCPEALESLAALMMVAGPKFDFKDWQHHSRFEAIISEMDEITKDKSTPPRVRFLLRDVLDMRCSGWKSSANQTALKAAPMKLEQVREKAAAEQVARPKNLSNCNQVQKTQRDQKASGRLERLLNIVEVGAKPRKQRGNPGAKVGACHVLAECSNARGKNLPDAMQKSQNAEVLEKTAPQVAVAVPAGPPARWADISDSDEERAPGHSPNSASTIPKELPKAPEAAPSPITGQFDLVIFRRALAASLAKLQADKNVPAAVQYIRLQQVPLQYQSDQFVDLLSRIVEERRGALRRLEFAFAAGLAAHENSPFDRKACLHGIALFFRDVYTDMCSEVQRLPAIIKSELLPTMYSVFTASEINASVPKAILDL